LLFSRGILCLLFLQKGFGGPFCRGVFSLLIVLQRGFALNLQTGVFIYVLRRCFVIVVLQSGFAEGFWQVILQRGFFV